MNNDFQFTGINFNVIVPDFYRSGSETVKQKVEILNEFSADAWNGDELAALIKTLLPFTKLFKIQEENTNQNANIVADMHVASSQPSYNVQCYHEILIKYLLYNGQYLCVW